MGLDSRVSSVKKMQVLLKDTAPVIDTNTNHPKKDV
jgi:hypothetical protein